MITTTTVFLVIFTLLFIVACYFFNFKHTNKMEIGINPSPKMPWSGNEHVFVSSLFTGEDKYVTGSMRLRYFPDKRTATIEYRNNNYIYHLDDNDDVRKLIPILLLSK